MNRMIAVKNPATRAPLQPSNSWRIEDRERSEPLSETQKKTRWRAFWDFFVLFSGISTASNLSRAQGRRIRGRGMFLFRKPPAEPQPPIDNSR